MNEHNSIRAPCSIYNFSQSLTLFPSAHQAYLFANALPGVTAHELRAQASEPRPVPAPSRLVSIGIATNKFC